MTYLIIYLLIGYPMALWALIEDMYGSCREKNWFPEISSAEMLMDLFVSLLMTPFWPIFTLWLLMPNFCVKMYTKLVLKIISKKSGPST